MVIRPHNTANGMMLWLAEGLTEQVIPQGLMSRIIIARDEKGRLWKRLEGFGIQSGNCILRSNRGSMPSILSA